uniref:Uncharacterized protein n=1 Tax=Corethron hystrix TaxID=216773 RepID=A0A7S1FM57_9STRA
MMASAIYISSALGFFHPSSSFTSLSHRVVHQSTQSRVPAFSRRTSLYMGRAAAVRAATKGKTDAKKAKINGQFGKKIIMAVKQGGSPDPVANRQLGDVIKQAKTNSVPADNIARAIKRASESSGGADFSESIFECYAQGGASMIVNVLTDNPNRAAAEIKNCFKKNDAKVAESGSVLFMYDRKGVLEVESELDEDGLLDAAIEAGCDDYEVVEVRCRAV